MCLEYTQHSPFNFSFKWPDCRVWSLERNHDPFNKRCPSKNSIWSFRIASTLLSRGRYRTPRTPLKVAWRKPSSLRSPGVSTCCWRCLRWARITRMGARSARVWWLNADPRAAAKTVSWLGGHKEPMPKLQAGPFHGQPCASRSHLAEIALSHRMWILVRMDSCWRWYRKHKRLSKDVSFVLKRDLFSLSKRIQALGGLFRRSNLLGLQWQSNKHKVVDNCNC